MGQIARKWRGCCEETFTDSDNFKIDFPTGIDVTKKALIIASTILVVSIILDGQSLQLYGYSSEILIQILDIYYLAFCSILYFMKVLIQYMSYNYNFYRILCTLKIHQITIMNKVGNFT